ncbi:MAG TPA: hypothetical protein VHY35_09285 [Stellaceae bacterium]|jgi:hypothetical protein|nr:hypothetical protein [Stellaceae bacterium]
MANTQQPAKPNLDKKVKPNETVGTDVPDESKERHTEIAVEAGRKGDGQHESKEKH